MGDQDKLKLYCASLLLLIVPFAFLKWGMIGGIISLIVSEILIYALMQRAFPEDIFDRLAIQIIASIIILLPILFSLDTYHPYVSLKETAFHFFLFLLVAFYVCKIIITEKITFRHSLTLFPLVGYILYATLSTIFFSYTDSYYLLNVISCGILFYFISLHIRTKTVLSYLMFSLAATTLPCVIYGILQNQGWDYSYFIGYFGARGIGNRVFSFFGNPDLFAAYLAMITPLLLGYFIYLKNLIGRILTGTLILLVLYNLILTQTRGGWIGLMAGMGCFIILLLYHLFHTSFGYIQKIILRKRSFIIVFFLIILCIGFFSVHYLYTNKELMSPTTVSIRLNYWKNAISLIKEHPLLGNGLGTFNVYYPAFRDKYIEYTLGETENEYRIEHPHEELLEILADLGVIGFVLFLGFIVVLIIPVFTLLKKQDALSYLLIGSVSGVMGVLSHNLFAQNLRFVIIMVFFWFFAGIIVVTGKMIQHEEIKEKRKMYKGSITKIIFCLIVLLVLFSIYYQLSYNVYLSDKMVKEGIGAYSAGNYDQALTFLRNAVTLDPHNKRAFYYIGISDLQKQQYSEARSTFDTLLRLDPNFISANYYKGIAEIYSGNADAAIQSFQTQGKLNNMHLDSKIALGTTYLQQNKLSEAKLAFQEALWIVNITHQDIQDDVWKRMLASYEKVGNREEQLWFYLKIFEHYDRSRNWEGYGAIAVQAYKIDPSDFWLSGIIESAIRLERYEDSLTLLNQSSEKYFNSNSIAVFNSILIQLLQHKEYSTARHIVQEIMDHLDKQQSAQFANDEIIHLLFSEDNLKLEKLTISLNSSPRPPGYSFVSLLIETTQHIQKKEIHAIFVEEIKGANES